jgi:hypothetical protein
VGKTHEALGILQQIRSKLDEARALSQEPGHPGRTVRIGVTLDTIIMGIDAQIGALESAVEPHGAQ